MGNHGQVLTQTAIDKAYPHRGIESDRRSLEMFPAAGMRAPVEDGVEDCAVGGELKPNIGEKLAKSALKLYFKTMDLVAKVSKDR